MGVYSACKIPKSGIRTPVLRNLAVEARFAVQGVMSRNIRLCKEGDYMERTEKLSL